MRDGVGDLVKEDRGIRSDGFEFGGMKVDLGVMVGLERNAVKE